MEKKAQAPENMKMRNTGLKVKIIEWRRKDDTPESRVRAARKVSGWYNGIKLIIWISPTGASLVRIDNLYFKPYSGYMGCTTVRLFKPYCNPETGEVVEYTPRKRLRCKLTEAQKAERMYARAVRKAREHLTKGELAALGIS